MTETQKNSEDLSLRSQCMAAYTVAALITTDTARYTSKEFAGFLLTHRGKGLTQDTLRLITEQNSSLLKRNLDALALLEHMVQEEGGQDDDDEEHYLTPSPLAVTGESDEKRIKRLLQEGTVSECLLEANHWLNYYLGEENAELEPVSTALALNERALSLLPKQEDTTKMEVQA